MAERLQILLADRSEWYELWNTPFVFLGVDSCNADECHSFSRDITLNLSMKSKFHPSSNFYSGILIVEIYFNSILNLLVAAGGKYSELKNIQQRKAVKTLIDFLTDLEKGHAGGKHFKCLSKMKSAAEISEAQIQAVLACHLFSPLLTEGKVVVDNRCYKNPGTSENSSATSTLKAECPFCKDPLNEDNTNFGVPDLWHGRADIVIKSKDSQEVVTVTVDENEEDEVGIWNIGRFIGANTYKQTISQTLLNAFLAVKKNNDLENTLVPSFLVSQSTIFINFYNVEQDILLVQAMPMKFIEGTVDNYTVNYYTFLAVFMALNFQYFPYNRPSQFPLSAPGKSGFKASLEKAGALERYKNEIVDQISFPRKGDSPEIRIDIPWKYKSDLNCMFDDHDECDKQKQDEN